MIQVNGQPRPLRSSTVAALVAELGYRPDAAGIAIAVNGEVVPRADWAGTELRAGDAVELVGAVQGG